MILRLLALSFAIAGVSQARDILAADANALETAIATAQPGDVVVLADGTWKDAEIVFRAVGTAEAPITLKAQTPGKVILTGESSLRFVGQHLVVDGLLFKDGGPTGHVVAFRGDSDEEASDCRLTNSAIIDYNPPAGVSSNWVSLYGARNRVDHCRFSGKNNSSPLLVVWLNSGQPNDHRIDRNYFGRRSFNGENGGETMRVGDSKTSLQISRTVVEENLFEDCDGEVEIISNKSCENIYRHNTFRRNAGTLTLRHGNRCVVEGNWFFGEGKASSGGIRIIGEDHRIINNYLADLTGERFFSALGFMAAIENSEASGYLQIKRAVVAFNTVVNCRNSIFIGIGFGSRNRALPPEDSLFANNIIVSQSAPLITQLVVPVRLTWLGNILFGAEVGLPMSEGISVKDPALHRDEIGLWLPSPEVSLPAASAPELVSVREDIFGCERGEGRESGCMQVSSQSPRRFLPLTPENTGVNWL